MKSNSGLSHRFLTLLLAAGAALAAAPPGALAQTTTTALFAHVATGHDNNVGDYSTIFTLLNTGSNILTGKLILTYRDGTPLTAAITGPSGFQTLASSVDLNIPIGGTQFWTAAGISPDDPVKTGWARVDSSGGTLGGVATFQLVSGTNLAAIAGVLASNATQCATIPVDNDDGQKRYTGYALANPGTDSISIKLVIVNQDGTVVNAGLKPIDLSPGRQIAGFLHQDSTSLLTFQGSVVMIEQSGKRFAVVALVQNQGLFTAIPVIPEKAPNIN
jgi:hypothetical protein